MKKKIHKIWGVGLTLVLAASLLLAAAPVSAGTLDWGTFSPFPSTTGNVLQAGDVTDLSVAADGTMYAVSGFANLGTSGGTSTATWSTVRGVSGNYSALLDFVDAHNYVDFTPVAGTTITDLSVAPAADFGFWYYLETSLPGPQLELKFTDPDSTAFMDVTFMLQSNAVLDTETVWNLGSTFGNVGTWDGTTSTNYATLALAVAGVLSTDMDFMLTKVRVELYDDPSPARTCYIDDVIIDGSLYDLEAGLIYKSTNGGVTWSGITNPTDAANAQMVAVAPDDSDTVVIVADGTEVYVSTNGGSTWGSLGTVQGDDSGDPAAATINDLAVSATDDGKNHVAVAGVDANGAADVWYFDVGAAAPAWEDTADEDDFLTSPSQTSALAVAFSPNVASDKVMTVVTKSLTKVYFQMFSLSTKAWNTPFSPDYPVEIEGDGTTANIEYVGSAVIELSPDYLGSDDAMRIAFVGLTTGTNEAGIYRLEDTTDKDIYDGSGVDIHSLAYDGTNLIAGFSINDKVYRSSDPLATTPSFSGTSSLKRPGTSGNFRVVVGWMGSDVVAGTSGAGSAFAISHNDGKSFNDISLIDIAGTDLGALDDVAVSADGSVVYMLARDSTALGLWRYASAWERVFSIATATGYIVRIAPEDPDAVYLAQTGSSAKTVYYSQEGGDTKWFSRVSKYYIQDMAVESASVAYIAVDGEARVSKTTNSGFTWGTSEGTGVAGDVHMITSLGEDKVIVGGTTGYVAWSTDGNSSWSKVNKQLDGATNIQVTASGLADGDFIYAAGDTASRKVERWEIGQSGTSWKDLSAPTTNIGAYGIALVEGVLYVQTAMGTGSTDDSTTLRNIGPTAADPASGDWSTDTEPDVQLTRTPQSLKVSAGSTTLWAVNQGAPALYYYEDTLATAGPTLSSPRDGYTLEMNPVSGISYSVAFTWERLSKAKVYDVHVALDSGFAEKVVSTNTTSTTSSTPSYVVDAGTFMPNTTYYWRIRVAGNGPVKSPYSEVRTFTVSELPEALAPVIIQQPPAPVISVPPAPAITIQPPEIVLPPYPAPAPAPETVIPPAPAAAPAVPSWALWAIIIVGAVLVIALIVLIMRTRRPI